MPFLFTQSQIPMSVDNGWIKLHRNSFNNKLYFSEPFTRWQAWCDLVLLANHKDGLFSIRGVMVKVKRGQVGHGIETISKRWKWSRGKVERFMRFLEDDSIKQIERQKNNVTTLISIVNYEKYQANDNANNKANDTTSSKADGHKQEGKEEKESLNTQSIVKHITKNFEKNGDDFRGINGKPSGQDLYAERLFGKRKQAEG